MKIIINGILIEPKDYEEGIRIIKSLDTDKEGINASIPVMPSPEISKGSGNYPHKSAVSEEKKAIIKKIFDNTPLRSLKSVSKELELTEDQVRYWRDKFDENRQM